MRKVRRWLKRYWWTFLVGAAAVGGIFLAILTPRRRTPDPDANVPSKPTFREQAEREVEVVKLEGEVEKARVTARADVQREQIDEIEVVGKDDPAEGRRQMASWLRDNL